MCTGLPRELTRTERDGGGGRGGRRKSSHRRDSERRSVAQLARDHNIFRADRAIERDPAWRWRFINAFTAVRFAREFSLSAGTFHDRSESTGAAARNILYMETVEAIFFCIFGHEVSNCTVSLSSKTIDSNIYFDVHVCACVIIVVARKKK